MYPDDSHAGEVLKSGGAGGALSRHIHKATATLADLKPALGTVQTAVNWDLPHSTIRRATYVCNINRARCIHNVFWGGGISASFINHRKHRDP
jgi:hypothetical protein